MCLDTEFIELDPSYPYYDVGIRGVECISGSFVEDKYLSKYNLYVDLKFVDSILYNIFNTSYCEVIQKIIVVSRPLNLSKDIFNYSKKLYFEINASDITLKTYMNQIYYDINQFNNYLSCNVNFKMNEYTIFYHINKQDVNDFKNIDKNIKSLNSLFLQKNEKGLCLNKYINAESYIGLDIEGDYDNILKYLKTFIIGVEPNKNMELVIGIYMKKSVYKEKLVELHE